MAAATVIQTNNSYPGGFKLGGFSLLQQEEDSCNKGNYSHQDGYYYPLSAQQPYDDDNGCAEDEIQYTSAQQEDSREEKAICAALQQIEAEDVSGVLKRLDSVRQLAGDAQVLRQKETKEQNTRKLHVAQLYSLLLEAAEFNAGAVYQRNVLMMLESIMLQHIEVFFFSVEEARKKAVSGPSVKLKEAISRPKRYEELLLVNAEVLSRMLSELSTDEILEIVNKSSEWLTFKQTTYQIKNVEEQAMIQSAAALVLYDGFLFVADNSCHCIWRVQAGRYKGIGKDTDGVELFAGLPNKSGSTNGPLLTARFGSPTGLCVDEEKHLMFVVESNSQLIRQINMERGVVSSISVTLDAGGLDYLKNSQLCPKGICVVAADKQTLEDMELSQVEHMEEFKRQAHVWNSQRPQHTSPSTSSDSSFESSEDSSGFSDGSGSSSGSSSSSGLSSGSDDGSRTGVSSSQRGSTSSGFSTDSSEAPVRTYGRNRQRRQQQQQQPSVSDAGYTDAETEDSCMVSATMRGLMPATQNSDPAASSRSMDSSGAPGSAVHKATLDDRMLTLEQSLALQYMKRYSVLPTEPGRERQMSFSAGLTRHRKDSAQLPSTGIRYNRAAPAVSATPASQATSASRRASMVEDDSEMDTRLVVTCDHCIWFINPRTGKARIIAGHPRQYGYCDARFGPASRFSSPKGVICVRSVLFVADYWNNVVRTVNLYTTQVDTVVDFNPQGPVAMSMSRSGVLYTLDSEHIHYAGVMRVMSTNKGDDRGTMMADDRPWYQSLFDQPRQRSGSELSSAASTFVTDSGKGTEVWDANAAHTKIIKDARQKPKPNAPVVQTMRSNPNKGPPSQNFRNRLAAHLQEQAEAETERKLQEAKEGGGKSRKGKKRKRKKGEAKRQSKKNKKKKRPAQKKSSSKPKLADTSSAKSVAAEASKEEGVSQSADHPRHPDPPAAAPGPVLSLQETVGQRKENFHSVLSDKLQIIAESEGSVASASSGKRRSKEVSSKRAQEEADELLQKMMDAGRRRSTENALGTQGPSGKTKTEPWRRRKTGLPQELIDFIRASTADTPKKDATRKAAADDISKADSLDAAASSRNSAGDYVDKTKMLLRAMSNLESGDKDRGRRTSEVNITPMTLSDLGVRERRGSVAQEGGIPRHRNSIHELDSSAVAAQLRRNSLGDTGYGGGTITPGQRSRSNSIIAVAPGQRSRSNSIIGVAAGVDQEAMMDAANQAGSVMIFNGQSFLRSGDQAATAWTKSVVGRRNSNAEDQDDILRMMQDGAARRHSLVQQVGSRRNSWTVAATTVTPGRRSSWTEGRRESFAERLGAMTARRDSFTAPVRRDSLSRTVPARRNSFSDRTSSLPVRRNSFSTGRRNSFGSSSTIEENKVLRRGSLARPSLFGSLMAMPTVYDKGEEEAESSSKTSKTSQARSSSSSSSTSSSSSSSSSSSEAAWEEGRDVNTVIYEEDSRRQSEGSLAGKVADEVVDDGRLTESVLSPSSQENPEELLDRSPQHLSPLSPESPRLWAPPMTAMGFLEGNRSPLSGPSSLPTVITLSKMPFTRHINVEALSCAQSETSSIITTDDLEVEPEHANEAVRIEGNHQPDVSRRTSKVTTSMIIDNAQQRPERSKVFRMLPLPEPVSTVRRTGAVSGRRYPNTPLSLVWFEMDDECVLYVGSLKAPSLFKIIPPKHHEPDRAGRFNVLPIDSSRVLLADEGCHQIWLLNHQTHMKKHLAGCGKRGYLDGPLDICRLNSPCSMCLDPRTHNIYVADRGNHVIRKIDLLSGLMTSVVGSGVCGNCDGGTRRRQALDSPFEVSFAEPYYLIISCADNSIRSFNLKTNYLETILVGS
eukprot:TRINITY_DN120894_c0_g1_i1.p1 TRINITY_DN120894_c0_g1~~TRINITY_DN120894_c0_g1_i1.p1  ORF type:complete len:1839 (+),score=373.80 TRINITY_DN120894_c0_g1_i1:87-5603(+)